MRVIFAALFVFGSMLGTIGVLSAHFGKSHWPWWSNLIPVLVMLLAMGVSLFFFNRRGYRPELTRKTLAERVAELERQGLLATQTFRAMRAFGVEEVEDEGLSYFVELVDGSVLFLSGQYLYEFEPTSDDPEFNQPRRFPCTEFEVLRHKDAGYVIDINCSGTVLEPELNAPAFTREDWKRGIPDDGEIVEGKSYDVIKRERVDA